MSVLVEKSWWYSYEAWEDSLTTFKAECMPMQEGIFMERVGQLPVKMWRTQMWEVLGIQTCLTSVIVWNFSQHLSKTS